MALAAEDIQLIKTHIGEWLAEQSLGKPPLVYEVELRERLVRLEETFKHQGEQFQLMLSQMDKRFEQVDKRLEMQRAEFNAFIQHHDRQFMWLISLVVAVGAAVIASFRLTLG